MTWEQINDWFDAFYKETVEGKKTIRGRAFSGGRIEIWGRDSVAMPSCTVPTCSNSMAISHITQCEMPLSRIAIAVAAATAAIPRLPLILWQT